jgi:hypothetical protein
MRTKRCITLSFNCYQNLYIYINVTYTSLRLLSSTKRKFVVIRLNIVRIDMFSSIENEKAYDLIN